MRGLKQLARQGFEGVGRSNSALLDPGRFDSRIGPASVDERAKEVLDEHGHSQETCRA